MISFLTIDSIDSYPKDITQAKKTFSNFTCSTDGYFPDFGCQILNPVAKKKMMSNMFHFTRTTKDISKAYMQLSAHITSSTSFNQSVLKT